MAPPDQPILPDSHPAEAAEWLVDRGVAALGALVAAPVSRAAQILPYLPVDLAVQAMAFPEAPAWLEAMDADDRVDILKAMEPTRAELLLAALPVAVRQDVERLRRYPDGSTGALMSTRFVAVRQAQSVLDAVASVREQAQDTRVLNFLPVLDGDHLVGWVSVRRLLAADDRAAVRDLARAVSFEVHALDDQEATARVIERYNLSAVPVVEGKRLLGLVTHDDAIDVIRQEQQEDLEKIMGIAGDHAAESYLSTSSLQHFRNRVGWVTALAVLGFVSGSIIHHYEDTLDQFLILSLYLPMITDAGGNTGSQAATVVIRALAMDEVQPSLKDLFRIVWKEAKISLMLAAVLGTVALIKVGLLSSGTTLPAGYTLWDFGFAISLALMLQVVTSTLLGAQLPMWAAKLKLDPAVVASPALTTLVDISGLLIYFSTVTLMLAF